MGLLDMVMGAVTKQATDASGTQGDLLSSVMGMISSNEGGLSGLVSSLASSGLKEQVASWVSTGANLPVSAEQIQSALGAGTLQDIASKMGIDVASVAGQLSSLLPQVIDKLTPDGNLPTSNSTGDLLASLSGLFGNKSA
jgi:uncharacterized protein YidB (DUF937 family)